LILDAKRFFHARAEQSSNLSVASRKILYSLAAMGGSNLSIPPGNAATPALESG
jgi:hypothetical protein